MLEDFASEQISSAAQRTYQDLPVAKIIGSGLKAQPAIVSSTETVATVLTNIAKIGTLASLPVGIVLLNFYLRDEGAPLPAADASISALLSLVCVIFLFWTLGSALTVLLPILERIFITPKSGTATDSFHRKPTAREYYLLYGPFLSVILFLFGVGVSDKHGTWSIGLIIIGLASIAVYWRVRYVTGYRKFGDVVWGILFSLVSFSGQFLFIGAITEQAYPHMNAWGVAFMCVGVPLAVHGLIFTYVTDWKKALRVYVLILVVLSRWPGLGFLGGLTLRYMGVGGGIPVSIRVKNYGRT